MTEEEYLEKKQKIDAIQDFVSGRIYQSPPSQGVSTIQRTMTPAEIVEANKVLDQRLESFKEIVSLGSRRALIRSLNNPK